MKPPALPKKKPARLRTVDPPFPEAHNHACLNCGRELSGNYCSNCGQPAGTHRLSIAHFVMHDLVHSLWHVDRGIFFTLKEVIVRPGYAATDFIRGRRTGRFPILTLLLLLLGILTWVNSLGPHHNPALFIESQSNTALVKQIRDFVEHNFKWILLGVLPVVSLSALIVFRRTKMNYTEHLLVSSYVFGGYLVILLLLKIIALTIPATAYFIDENKNGLAALFYIFGYWQAYHAAYSIPGIIWRFAVLSILDSLMIFLALILAATVVVVFNLAVNPGFIDQIRH